VTVAVLVLGNNVEIPLSVYRDGKTFDVMVTSSDRNRHLRVPKMH
jgi:hypothetical protein